MMRTNMIGNQNEDRKPSNYVFLFLQLVLRHWLGSLFGEGAVHGLDNGIVVVVVAILFVGTF